MGNKLRELFERQDSYKFTIHFNESDVGDNFQTNLKEFLTDPKKNYFRAL